MSSSKQFLDLERKAIHTLKIIREESHNFTEEEKKKVTKTLSRLHQIKNRKAFFREAIKTIIDSIEYWDPEAASKREKKEKKHKNQKNKPGRPLALIKLNKNLEQLDLIKDQKLSCSQQDVLQFQIHNDIKYLLATAITSDELDLITEETVSSKEINF